MFIARSRGGRSAASLTSSVLLAAANALAKNRTAASSSSPPTMATPTQIVVPPDQTGLWRLRQTPAAAATVSALLEADLREHHVFFNNDGFHNHIPHHLLSLYGTGAPAAALQSAYDANKGYQRRARGVHRRSSESSGSDAASLSDAQVLPPDWYETTAPAHLGKQSYYADFLRFFQLDMERRAAAAQQDSKGSKGSKGNAALAAAHAVVRDRLCAGTPAADDLLVRLFAGFLHPLIQLMYGLEWDQPAMVAQGLAQAAVHRPGALGDFLFAAEAGEVEEDVPLLALYREVAQNPQLASAVRMSDANKLSDGVLARARDAMVAVAARVRVAPTAAAVAARTAEMAEACVYVAASAALHPHKAPKFDFFLIHHVNSIPFFLTLLDAPWLPVAAKARLLAWKIRMDLAQYAARACTPLLDPAVFASYHSAGTLSSPPSPPPDPSDPHAAASSADNISPAATAAAARLFHLADDDGHAIKLVCATGVAERAVRGQKQQQWPRILASDAVWDGIYRLETDAILGPGTRWVRTAGLDEAWENVKDEPQYEL